MIHLTLDPVVWEACPIGLEVAMCTLAAMSNPKSSFRDEFQKMGGLACVGLCYLHSDEPERLNVFQQVLRGLTAEEFKLLSPENAFSFFKLVIVNCLDLEIEDREELIPSLFAKLHDTTTFQQSYQSWLNVAMFRKDCPSAFLLFVSIKSDQLTKRYPKVQRSSLGLMMGKEEEEQAMFYIYAFFFFPSRCIFQA